MIRKLINIEKFAINWLDCFHQHLSIMAALVDLLFLSCLSSSAMLKIDHEKNCYDLRGYNFAHTHAIIFFSYTDLLRVCSDRRFQFHSKCLTSKNLNHCVVSYHLFRFLSPAHAHIYMKKCM